MNVIVLYKGAFDHSNRLFQQIHFESFCIEHNIQFINLSFIDLKYLYQKPGTKIETALYRFTNYLVRLNIIKTETFDTPGDFAAKSKKVIDQKGIRFCSGWYFHVNDLVVKHRSFLQRKYKLKDVFYQHNALFNQLKNEQPAQQTLIGIHLRKGDYITFEDGRYFYDDSVYLRIVDEMEQELKLKSTKKNLFILFSDQKINIKPKQNYIISTETWFIDHFIMSKCDYLIGPPSTFTLWASYIGNVKYYHVINKDDDIKISKFLVA